MCIRDSRHLVLLPGAEIQGILHPHGADDVSFLVNRQIGSYDELNAHDGVQGAVRFTQGCKAEIGLLPVSYTHLDVYKRQHHIIETPLFVDSTLTGMVQIADLCAYALKRLSLIHI